MSIVTKAGDKGQTSLYTGEIVWKDDIRVDAYGTLDELDAQIGEVKHLVRDSKTKNALIDIQKKLYKVMGQLAFKDGFFPDTLSQKDVDKLTEQVNELEFKVDLKGFVIPGGTPDSAKLDICRAITRRAERRLVTLARAEEVPEVILQYVNRLSDYFFILARWLEKKENALAYVS